MATDLPTIKSYQQALQNAVGAAFTCIIAIILFVLADALLSSTFITFLQTLQAEIQLQKTELQALVSQSTVMLGIINAELGILNAAASVANGLNNRFPVGILSNCLPQTWVNAVQGGLTSGTSSGSSFMGNVGNVIQTTKKVIRDLQYNEQVLQNKINQINQAIGQLNLFNSQIQALIDYFNALKNYAGTLPHLPL